MHVGGHAAHLRLVVIEGDDTLHDGAASAAALLALALGV